MADTRSEAPALETPRPQVEQKQGQRSMDAYLRQAMNRCQHYRDDVDAGDGRPIGLCYWDVATAKVAGREGKVYDTCCDGIEDNCEHVPAEEAA